MQMDKADFIKEWESGKYNKISDCPTYPTIKAYCDAINILRKASPKVYLKNFRFSPIDIIRNH